MASCGVVIILNVVSHRDAEFYDGSAPGLVDIMTCPQFCYLFLVDFRRVVVAS